MSSLIKIGPLVWDFIGNKQISQIILNDLIDRIIFNSTIETNAIILKKKNCKKMCITRAGKISSLTFVHYPPS